MKNWYLFSGKLCQNIWIILLDHDKFIKSHFSIIFPQILAVFVNKSSQFSIRIATMVFKCYGASSAETTFCNRNIFISQGNIAVVENVALNI